MPASTATCTVCGLPRPESGPDVLAWGCERTPDGTVGWLCPGCARRHVREIEAKLAPEWWETSS